MIKLLCEPRLSYLDIIAIFAMTYFLFPMIGWWFLLLIIPQTFITKTIQDRYWYHPIAKSDVYQTPLHVQPPID